MLVGLVCCHVSEGVPPLMVARQEPQDQQDSGWSVGCDQEHDLSEWLTADVERFFSGVDLWRLRATMQEGQLANRATEQAPWVVQSLPEEEAA